MVWEEGGRHVRRSACVYSVRWAVLDKCDYVCMCVSVLDHFHLVYCALLSVFTYIIDIRVDTLISMHI